jgi:hypothetical protein
MSWVQIPPGPPKYLFSLPLSFPRITPARPSVCVCPSEEIHTDERGEASTPSARLQCYENTSPERVELVFFYESELGRSSIRGGASPSNLSSSSKGRVRHRTSPGERRVTRRRCSSFCRSCYQTMLYHNHPTGTSHRRHSGTCLTAEISWGNDQAQPSVDYVRLTTCRKA